MRYFYFLIILFNSLNIYADWKEENFEGSKVFVYVPKSQNSDYRLIVNLHGCAQKASDLKDFGNWEEASELNNTIVLIPEVPNGGKFAGCWDFYGTDHTKLNRDNVFVLKLVEKYLKNESVKIDKNSVYISGISSGGGVALNLLCLAPDVFAGGGLVATTAIGTDVTEILSVPRSLESHVKVCNEFAKQNNLQAFFSNQVVSLIYDENDYFVNHKHSLMNLEMFKNIYDLKIKKSIEFSEINENKNKGNIDIYSDDKSNRLSVIMNKNLGHNWPAGKGEKEIKFINKDSINYPKYLLDFLIKNNKRKTKV